MQDSFSIAIETPENIKTIKQYESQIEELRSENFGLKHQLSYYRAHGDMPEHKQICEMEKITNENKRHLEDLSKYMEIEQKYHKLDQEYKSKEKELYLVISDLKQKEENLINTIKSQKEIFDNLQMKLSNASNNNETLSTTIKSQADKILALEESLRESNGLVNTLRQENDDNFSSYTKNNNKISFLDNIVGEQANKINELEKINRELNNQVNQLLNENEQVRGNCSNVQAEYEQLKNNISHVSAEYDQIQNIKYSFEMRASEYVQEIDLLKEKIKKLEIQKNTVNSEDTENNLKILKKEYEQSLSKYNLLKEKYEKLRREYNTSEHTLATLQVRYSSLIESTDSARKEHASLRESYNTLFSTNTQLKSKYKFLVLQFGKEVEKVHIQASKLSEKIKKTIIKKKNIKVLKKLKIRTSSHNEIISCCLKLIKKLKNKNVHLETEVDDISSFLSQGGDKNTLKLIEDFSKEFEHARNDLNICQKYLEKKGNENKTLKIELKKLRRCHYCISA